MRKLIVTMALLVMIGGPAAIAQTAGSGGSTGLPSSAGARPSPNSAPIGHRQPRPGEVPSEKSLSDPNTPANREDAELDRKIKSICRGC
jgi:hypothetical protein